MAMDDSQTLVLDTLARFLSDWQASRDHMPSPEEANAFWSEIGKIGLLGALAPESAGGLGDDPHFLFDFLYQWGRSAAPGPLITSLIGGSVLLPETVHEPLLGGIADGSVRLAISTQTDAPGTFPAIQAGTDAGSVARLPRLAYLRDAPFATHAILPARIGEDAALLCVETAHLSLSRPLRLVDGATAAELLDKELPFREQDIVFRGADAEMRWISCQEHMSAAAACEAAGLLQAMLDQTVAYVRQRVQFGQPIASFQVIQHRLADMLVDVEQVHSLAFAAMASPDDSMLVSAAKVRADRSLRYVSDQAVQLHGGIGTTQELSLNRYFRRAMAMVPDHGGSSPHLQRVEEGLLARMQIPRNDTRC